MLDSGSLSPDEEDRLYDERDRLERGGPHAAQIEEIDQLLFSGTLTFEEQKCLYEELARLEGWR